LSGALDIGLAAIGYGTSYMGTARFANADDLGNEGSIALLHPAGLWGVTVKSGVSELTH